MSAKPIRWKCGQYGSSETGYIDGIKVAVCGESMTRGVDGFSLWVLGIGNLEGRFPIKEAKAVAQKRVSELVGRLKS